MPFLKKSSALVAEECALLMLSNKDQQAVRCLESLQWWFGYYCCLTNQSTDKLSHLLLKLKMPSLLAEREGISKLFFWPKLSYFGRFSARSFCMFGWLSIAFHLSPPTSSHPANLTLEKLRTRVLLFSELINGTYTTSYQNFPKVRRLCYHCAASCSPI